MKKYFLKRINEIKELDITDIVMYFAALGLDIDPTEVEYLDKFLASSKYLNEKVEVADYLICLIPYLQILKLNMRRVDVLLTLLHCHLQANRPPPSEEVLLVDAQLVSREAGVEREEAIAALEQTKGDLAKAILLLLKDKMMEDQMRRLGLTKEDFSGDAD